MKIKHLSPSSINTFDMCNFAYYLTYDLKMRGFQNKGAALGTVTHAILEGIAKRMMHGKEDLAEISRIYDTRTKRLNIHFNKAIRDYPYLDFDQKDYDLCMKWVDHILYRDKASYMRQKIIGVEQGFDLIISKDGELIDTDIAQKCKDLGVDEYEYVEALTGDKAFRILGFIDLVIGRASCIEIIDYKTSKMAKSYDELKEDVQLSVYNLVSHFLWPEYDSRMATIYYLRKKPISLYMDGGIERTLAFLQNKWNEIRRCENPQRTISGINKRWKCRFCSFFDNSAKTGDKQACKRDCDLFYALNSQNCDLTKFIEEVKNMGSVEELLRTGDFKHERELIYGDLDNVR